MNFSSNSSGYFKRKSAKKRVYIIISVLIMILAATAVIFYCEGVRMSTGSSVAEALPAPEAVTSADLTDSADSPEVTVSPEPIASPEVTASPDMAEEVSTGEQAIIHTPEPTFQPDLLKIVRNKDGIKTAYLTFDDGPTKSITPKVLDVLRRYNVKATFFMVGTLIESNPDMARRVYEEGHLLANHSYAHEYKELYATSDAFISEIQRTEQLIKNITCEEELFKLFRYPGGSYNAGTWGENKQIYKNVLADMGYYYCDWNSLNGDAEGGEKTPEQLVAEVVNSSEGKEDVVILMHDAATKKNTVESLPAVIEYLMSQGYTFARLDA